MVTSKKHDVGFGTRLGLGNVEVKRLFSASSGALVVSRSCSVKAVNIDSQILVQRWADRKHAAIVKLKSDSQLNRFDESRLANCFIQLIYVPPLVESLRERCISGGDIEMLRIEAESGLVEIRESCFQMCLLTWTRLLGSNPTLGQVH
jgi:endo-1,4-beta-mannosidase